MMGHKNLRAIVIKGLKFKPKFMKNETRNLKNNKLKKVSEFKKNQIKSVRRRLRLVNLAEKLTFDPWAVNPS
jgi:hypothetical protein